MDVYGIWESEVLMNGLWLQSGLNSFFELVLSQAFR